jgi:hypothetical protein
MNTKNLIEALEKMVAILEMESTKELALDRWLKIRNTILACKAKLTKLKKVNNEGQNNLHFGVV